MTTSSVIIPSFFGDAIDNTPGITVFMGTINLDLKLDNLQIEKEETKTNVMDIVNNINNSNNYILPVRVGNGSVTKIKETNEMKLSVKVSNINNLENVEDFISLFSNFGSIRRTSITKNKDYGFITYHEHTSAQKAVNGMNRYKYNYCILDVTIAN